MLFEDTLPSRFNFFIKMLVMVSRNVWLSATLRKIIPSIREEEVDKDELSATASTADQI